VLPPPKSCVIRQDLLRGLDQIEHLGPALLDDGIAKDHHLGGQRGDEDNGQNRDDHRKTVVDGKMSHDGRLRGRSGRRQYFFTS
jgi:hypothetical protein